MEIGFRFCWRLLFICGYGLRVVLELEIGYRLFILGDGFRYKFCLIFAFGTAGLRRLDVESVGRVLSIRKYWILVLSGEEKSVVYALGPEGFVLERKEKWVLNVRVCFYVSLYNDEFLG